MSSIKNEKIIIIGGSGSGKDFLMRKLIKKGLTPCLKWTTRPMRANENQGIDYNFVSDELFIESINESKFLAYQKFNVTPENKDPETWYYGLTNEAFSSAQVFIMTPGEFKYLSDSQRSESFVVYLDIPRSVRESRVIKRDDQNDSVKRRLDSDEVDFIQFCDYDLRITDPEFGVDDIYNLMD